MCCIFVFLPFWIEHFGRRLGYIAFDGGVRSRRYVTHAGRAIGAVGGRRRDSGGAGDGRYTASEPVLGLRKGQIFISDAAYR